MKTINTKVKTHKRYKFLRTGYKSEYGDFTWKVGKWYELDTMLDGSPVLCERGFHCSKGIWQAFNYVQGEILAEVEVSGKSDVQDDKEAWEKMRLIKTYRWTKKDSVLFSVYAARLVLKNFEDIYPDDDRPRKAIEAAEAYVKNPTNKNRSAAWSAAESAASSAWSAAESAASSAAWSAAESAASSAWSAASSAAWSAAWSAANKNLDKWMINHLKELRVLKEIK